MLFSSVADSTKNVKRYRAQRFKYARNQLNLLLQMVEIVSSRADLFFINS
jgi:hypothetical protein